MELDEFSQTWQKRCAKLSRLMRAFPELNVANIRQDIFHIVEQQDSPDLDHLIEMLSVGTMSHEDKLLLFVSIVQAYEMVEWRTYDLSQQRPRVARHPTFRRYCLRLNLPGLSKRWSPLWKNDFIVLENNNLFECFKVWIRNDDVLFHGAPSESILKPYLSDSFDVSFFDSGSLYGGPRDAIEQLRQRPYIHKVLRSAKTDVDETKINMMHAKIDFNQTNTEILETRLEPLDSMQKRALIHIIEAKCRPNPYLVTGAPGTGKTRLLVEAVVQIYTRDKEAKILITTRSNSIADNINEMLKDTALVPSLRRFPSNPWYSDERVIVTTNLHGSKLDEQFDYILIDEATLTREYEILIPVLLMKPNGFLVLFGDPEQVGLYVKHKIIEKLGITSSLFERLLQQRIYMPIGERKLYDERSITKLSTCYRSDPRLMQPFNEIFYNNQLKCLGRTPPELLDKLKLKSPIVFHQIEGNEVFRPEYPQYRYNEQEAHVCVDYVLKLQSIGLKSSQIGIITENKLQTSIIEQTLIKRLQIETNGGANQTDEVTSETIANQTSRFLSPSEGSVVSESHSKENNNGPICKVDSVIPFIGVDREVIIISTVRTSPDHDQNIWGADLVTDPRKFNTAVGRAKWLVIVVGHPCIRTMEQSCARYLNNGVTIEGGVAS